MFLTSFVYDADDLVVQVHKRTPGHALREHLLNFDQLHSALDRQGCHAAGFDVQFVAEPKSAYSIGMVPSPVATPAIAVSSS